MDTGAGGLEPKTGKLIPNLRAKRIAPEDIDTVILTYDHPDHIGGNGVLRKMFVSAIYEAGNMPFA